MLNLKVLFILINVYTVTELLVFIILQLFAQKKLKPDE